MPLPQCLYTDEEIGFEVDDPYPAIHRRPGLGGDERRRLGGQRRGDRRGALDTADDEVWLETRSPSCAHQEVAVVRGARWCPQGDLLAGQFADVDDRGVGQPVLTRYGNPDPVVTDGG